MRPADHEQLRSDAIRDPILGVLDGDDFLDWRPTRYWREVLRQEGEANRLSDETITAFKYREAAVPVLRTCARDDNRNERWPAELLLGRLALHHNHATLPTLREALKDDDVGGSALRAIIGLGNLRANAIFAAPDIVPLMKGPELQVRFLAEKALWAIKKKLAIEAGGWRPFRSARWKFSVSFPSPLHEEQKPNTLDDRLVIHWFSSAHGATRLTVAITECPPELFQGTDEERLAAGRDAVLFGLGGKLLDDQAFERGSIKGREFVIEKTIERNGVTNRTLLKSRVFWIERRQYHVQAAYNEELCVVPAVVDYFFDSFEIQVDDRVP